ncbi:Uncharacterised protein [Mycobacterium tuberculosis]|nr:Uncharacterised protein [Mycobacterium tuberculosis]CKS81045.1 Uncharacterised protein [Mycobacterium tuberculosis]COW58710.1 Uncharacterised protein [Mycobacterium tuberculosis]COX22114.1 Uncharacterised protein [Mycobacterium tuberculosis]
MLPWKTSRLMEWLYPTSTRTGAVSPTTRAMDNKMPDTMPGIAIGATIRTIVFHFGTPNA